MRSARCNQGETMEPNSTETKLVPSGKPSQIIGAGTLFQQYKLAVEMWDRVRSRRQQANVFFAGIDTGIIAAVATFGNGNELPPYLPMTGILICGLWLAALGNY